MVSDECRCTSGLPERDMCVSWEVRVRGSGLSGIMVETDDFVTEKGDRAAMPLTVDGQPSKATKASGCVKSAT